MRRAVALAACAALAPLARAADVDVRGWLDCRLVGRADERSYADGGLGKTRFGGGGVDATCAQAGVAFDAVLAPALAAHAQLQYQATGRDEASLLDAWLRYRPVSTTPLRWSVRLGAFFPPVSLENDALGWSSPWTLSSSAINAWVGEELRGIGAEGTFEWRGERSTFAGVFALVRSNDPAGELLAARGWSISDLVSGLGSRVREPDAYARDEDEAVPLRFNPFLENDGRLGWYAGASWETRGVGTISLLRYDNEADPASRSRGTSPVLSWHTDFWSLGAQSRVGDVVLLGQAMSGSTAIAPSPFFATHTDFRAAYLLAARDRGAWRPAVRIDAFSTDQLPRSIDGRVREHGSALTVALNWRPRAWLRVTGEALHVRSWRNQRELEGLPAQRDDTQLQLGLRVIF
ncbi:porin [Dokdonella fugitiva]|uniref:porin n=1 Tax=Dokdonella fugitiva TaxID=328517 RepID=UPI00104717B1|nr:porin [Dokdonella fugitiva]